MVNSTMPTNPLYISTYLSGLPCFGVNLLSRSLHIAPTNRDKVDMPNSVTGRARTHIIEWYIFRCGSENGDYKDIYLKEMGMHV